MANPIISRLPILILYPHNRCNCRCVMCDIWKIDSAEEISAAELEHHLDQIAGLRVEWIVFSGGEPLMHSDLFRLSALAHSRGIRTTMLSTGLLLARNATRVAQSIDDVIVSLDGPPAVHDAIRRVPGGFDLLATGVQAIRATKSAYPVAARSTIQRSNALRLRETVRAARDIGFDSISFLAVDAAAGPFHRVDARPSLAPTLDELPALHQEVEALIEEECDRGFVIETPEKLRRIVRHFRAYHGLEEPEAPRCNAPWVSAVLETDGTVRPCFFHDPIGNARSDSLVDIINGPRAIEFRANLQVAENPVCRRCVCSLHRSN
ncbi:MAG: radical SAM protein [Bryobacteraceae bacterium]